MKSLAYYMTLPYRLEVIKRKDGFLASYPDLPDCSAYGLSVEQAMANAVKEKERWLTNAINSATDIPMPKPEDKPEPAKPSRRRKKESQSDEFEAINKYYPPDKPIRVAVYIRAKVVNNGLRSPIELQKRLYTEIVGGHINWELAGIYADEGNSVSIKKRQQLSQLLSDCEQGQIDVVITKDFSRITPLVSDCMRISSHLASLPHPVGIYFENDKLLTLNAGVGQGTINKGVFGA